MNAMVMSILYKSSPRDVRFIMIDPKMLELSIYENVPTSSCRGDRPKKAAAALSNIEREMDLRYRLLHEKGVRNIDSYNRLLRDSAGVEEAPASPRACRTTTCRRIIIIIDELADLMMMVGARGRGVDHAPRAEGARRRPST